MTLYECACGARFEFLIRTQYRRDGWGLEHAYHLNENFDAWREWLTEHKPHGTITPIKYQGEASD